jgi:hypothetical protein
MTQSTAIGRGVAFMAASAACWLVFCHGAYAVETCRGVYSGSLIHPLPARNVVQYEPESNDPATLTDLGMHFLTGLQRGGVMTTGRPNTRLYVVAIVTPRSGTSSRQRANDRAEDTSASAETVSGTLELSLTLRDIQTTDTIWVGSLSCTILTNDKMRVAETIGELLGHAVGKDFATTRFQGASQAGRYGCGPIV